MKKIISITLLSILLSVYAAEAATYFFSPAKGTYEEGKSYTVGIYVQSPSTAVNAVEGTFNFPTDKLQVTSISKGGSIINLWVQEPSYSNTNGTVRFEGIVLNPGYQGSNGRVISVTFRAKSTGDAVLGAITGQILANDGNGTNLYAPGNGARFTLVEPSPDHKPEVEAIEALEAPTLTFISKEMHSGDPLVMRGQTYPNTTVKVWVARGDGEAVNASLRSDKDGKFTYIHESKLDDGLYQVWAEISDAQQSLTSASAKESVTIAPPKIVIITKTITDYLTLAVTAGILILAFIITLTHVFRRLRRFRVSILKETKQVDGAVVKNFKRMEENLSHIEFLEKGKSKKFHSTEEEYVFLQLKQNLTEARDEIRKEVKDIDNLARFLSKSEEK